MQTGWLLMILVVLFSFITSDYFPQRATITGAAIVTLGDVGYNIGHMSSNYDDPYINDPIVFYITIFNISNQNPLSGASCKFYLDVSTRNMNYNSDFSQYETTNLFQETGSYNYTVVCDMSAYGEEEINETNTIVITTPDADFTVDIDAPGSSSINSNTEITATITNIGPGDFEGNLLLTIDYGDDNVENQSVNMTGEIRNVYLFHNYSSKGSYTIYTKINSDESISETNTSNNEDTSSITIVNASAQPMTCGQISSSITMEDNFYCAGDIWFSTGNLILDCNNYKIYGDGKLNGKRGIYIGSNDITIKNCVIEDYEVGILANEKLTLVNSSISDTKTALIINSTSSSLDENIFKDNDLAIQNYKASAISFNDFYNNTLDLNTSIALNFSKNYFNTDDYDSIVDKILNTSVYVTLTPFYNDSSREDNPTEIFIDDDAPTFTITATSEEVGYRTDVTIDVDTDEIASCRYSESDKSYEDMNTLPTTDNINHMTTVSYDNFEVLKFHVICKDTSDNSANATLSGELTLRSPSLIAIDTLDLEDELDYYEDKKKDSDEEKAAYQSKLKSETDPAKKKEIQTDMKETEADVLYYKAAVTNIKDLKKSLHNISNNTVDLYEDYLEDYKEDIDELIINVSETKSNIENSFDSNVYTVNSLISKLDKYLGDLYKNYINYENKNKDKQDYRNDHKIPILERDQEDREDEKIRFQTLEDLGEDDYDDYITDIDDELEDIEEDLNDSLDDEILDDFDLEIEMLENKIEYKKEHKEELKVMIAYIETALDNLSNTGQTAGQYSSLKNIKTSAQDEIEDIDDDIDDLEDDIDEVETEKENYEDDVIVVIADKVGESTVRMTWTSNEVNNTLTKEISKSNMYLSKATITITRTAGTKADVDITRYDNNPNNNSPTTTVPTSSTTTNSVSSPTGPTRPTPPSQGGGPGGPMTGRAVANVGSENQNNNTATQTTLEWYIINESNGAKVIDGELYFRLNKSYVSQLKIPVSNITLFSYDIQTKKLSELQTGYVSGPTYYEFIGKIASSGTFALGYVIYKETDDNTDNTDENTTIECGNWTCGEWSECDEEGNKKRSCIDSTGCEADKEEKSECFLEESCDDGIRNQDEKGIDCGGVCPMTCITADKPKSNKKNSWIPTVLIIVIMIAVGGLVFEKYSMKKKGTKTSNSTFEYELIDKISQEMFQHKSAEEIKQEFGSSSPPEELDYTISLVSYIIGKINESTPTQSIIDELVQQKWEQTHAEEIIKHITLLHMMNQIDEFYSVSEQNEEEDNIIKDIFKTDGFNDEMITKAFEEYKNKKGTNITSNKTQEDQASENNLSTTTTSEEKENADNKPNNKIAENKLTEDKVTAKDADELPKP